MEVDLKQVQKTIESQFISYPASRTDVVLFPLDDLNGMFFVIYTVEYVDTTDIASIKIAEGRYIIFPEKNALFLNIGNTTKTIKL
ncbi:hypothetical protein [Sulfuracidifex metallicus]|uniref:hypothetical protein n=1 Tax=Sulfuracidifex metallicus TaxID=47303 RepID=UPI002276867E|nr:hypothetical protein [Sulfuracidifex metallicus]MCY0851080.1 hypothetical protein [Sulfuracidifex metallicus]